MDKLDARRIIHITEIGDCPRRFQYMLQDHVKAPTHITSLRGTITHSAIRQMIQHGRVIDYSREVLLQDKLKEADDKLFKIALELAYPYISRAKSWLDDNDVLDEIVISEERINCEHVNFIITGQLDCYTSKAIVDFKTGKRYLTADHKRQLAGYQWLLDHKEKRPVNVKDRDWYIVFLGNDDPEEVQLTDKDKAYGRKSFNEQLKETITSRKLMMDGCMTECRLGIKCAFCHSRNICIGL